MAKKRRFAPPARWALQDAKNRLSEVVDAALRGQPQVVTRRGVETAVVISHDQYARMSAASDEKRASFVDYLVRGPIVEAEASAEVFERIHLRSRART